MSHRANYRALLAIVLLHGMGIACGSHTGPNSDPKPSADADAAAEMCGATENELLRDPEFQSTSGACFRMCIDEAEPGACWAQCVTDESELLPGCATCLSYAADCAAVNCRPACDDAGPECEACMCEYDCIERSACGIAAPCGS